MPTANDVEPRERIREVLKTWAHNRNLYPGWLVYPSGQERFKLSSRTDDWEPPILNSLPDFTPSERLNAVREVIWRREILLEPITLKLEAAAQAVLDVIDCERQTIEGVKATRDDWADIRDAWRTVALALVTVARIDCKIQLFERRLDSLIPFANDGPDVVHRIQQERCLWAVYSMAFDHLNSLLDDWPVENCDPVWALRKAALLTEARRYDESSSLIQSALNSLRKDVKEGKSISSASREGWALASTLTMNNQQMVSREWDKLASQKCDAGAETDYIRRAMMRTTERDEAPSFDLGIRRSNGIRFSNASRSRVIAAYRAIRLPEVTGLPPVNNPKDDSLIPMSMVSDTLKMAAEELVATDAELAKPELAVRLLLRICSYDNDKSLQRVLSRTSIAGLSDDSVAALARICIGVIKYALPRLFETGESLGTISWIERMRVALEVLSRLALRLSPDMVDDTLSVGLECYQSDRVPQHPFLASPVRNLLRRSWRSLPKNRRASRVLDLLGAPIVGLDGFAGDANCPDPGEFVNVEDLPSKRTLGKENQYREVVDFLIRGLLSIGEARKRATFRLIPLVISDILTDGEALDVANALWCDSDPVFSNASGPSSPFDWVYLILPELDKGKAEQSFRGKWLTPRSEKDSEGLDYATSMLTQVGAAVSGLRQRDRPFCLSTEDEQHIAVHTEKLVEMFSSSSVRFDFGIMATITHIGSLISEITFPDDIAENLFQRVEFMLGPQTRTRDLLIAPLHNARIALAFALVPGLVKAMPDRIENMSIWLRTGLASEDDARVRGTLSALQFWLSASTNTTLRPVPDDLIREVGVIIASDRRIALADALICATLVFDKGSEEHRDTIGPLALLGLSYLAEKLQYVPDPDSHDGVHTLRLLCAQLATYLARDGFENDATVAKWLEIGRSDLFPEMRNVVLSYETE